MLLVKRVRRKPPKAKPKLRLDGYTAAELGAQVGVSARTVRYYTAQHLLPAPEFRGSATRYLHEHLVHLAAIRHLQRDRRESLDAIRQILGPLSGAEIEQLAAHVLPEPCPPAPPPAETEPTPTFADAWERQAVVPGLEIHLHVAASVEVRAMAVRLAQSIRSGK